MSVNNNPNNPLTQQQYTTQQSTNQQNATANTAHTEQVRVTRELDGLNSTGIVGELLTNGTSNLAEANKYFAMSKFAVTGLLAEDNQAVSTAATILKKEGDTGTQVACADDMYVAGDPGVGGKGNNYAFNEVNVQPGYYTMYEDGKDGGPKITVNAHAEAINPEGKNAFTEYGFIIQDPNGTKTKATLSGGVLTIIGADGSTRKLLPGEEYTVGNTTPPTAKFYYADVPGAGKDGATEKRLMVDYYEKPSQETIDKLVSEGVSRADAEKLLSVKTMSFGFRTPDGNDTYALPEGVGAGAALKTLPNGVKTYYDAHFSTGSCTVMDATKCGCPPTPPPPPPPPPPTTDCPPEEKPPEEPPPIVAANQHARIWEDPHIDDADGGKYDFNQRGLFNVLKDKGITLNAKTVAGPANATYISESGLTIGGRTVLIQTGGRVTIGYTDPNVTTPPITLGNNQTVMLDNGYSITRKGTSITVDTTTGEYRIKFDTGRSWQGTNFMDIDIWSKSGGVLSDGVAPSGLLGETFDADNQRQRSTKNSVDSYRVASLFSEPTATPTSGTTTTGGTGGSSTGSTTGSGWGSVDDTAGSGSRNTTSGSQRRSRSWFGGRFGNNTDDFGDWSGTSSGGNRRSTSAWGGSGGSGGYSGMLSWLMQMLGINS